MEAVHGPEGFHRPPSCHQKLVSARVKGNEVCDVIDTVPDKIGIVEAGRSIVISFNALQRSSRFIYQVTAIKSKTVISSTS